ncbi:MAG: tryptophan 2,3-dioxygenase family protein [Pseudomonadota bacterium]
MPTRKLEASIHTDLRNRKSYSGYLCLDKVLSAQHPLSEPAHHDEMLFIIQHQVAELWFKLIAHELEAVRRAFRDDALHQAQKQLLRVKRIQAQLIDQWQVLSTLTPSEYAEFRHVFGDASGFQSVQYRYIEFLLGARDSKLADMHKHDAEWHERLRKTLQEPSVYDEFLISLCRLGFEIPAVCTTRDFSVRRKPNADVVAAFKVIYDKPNEHWAQYEICESLTDITNNFQFWQFHHLKTVERIIGHKPGTGGSSGVAFLKRALDDEFFPELIQVRTEIGKS